MRPKPSDFLPFISALPFVLVGLAHRFAAPGQSGRLPLRAEEDLVEAVDEAQREAAVGASAQVGDRDSSRVTQEATLPRSVVGAGPPARLFPSRSPLPCRLPRPLRSPRPHRSQTRSGSGLPAMLCVQRPGLLDRTRTRPYGRPT